MTDLVKRLRKVEPDIPGERTRWYRNPDGQEAADRIEQLESALLKCASIAERHQDENMRALMIHESKFLRSKYKAVVVRCGALLGELRKHIYVSLESNKKQQEWD